ncbi:sensor histidine kinase [Micromonospora sp. WMMD754]|uniref:sensor histidine kinase n=1 Tax=Micromonospora sp. WMMD754 TaxID=3404114 RepID=UPI003BF4B9F8
MTDRLPARRVRATLLTAAVAYALGRLTRRRPAGEARRDPGATVVTDEHRRIARELHDLVAHRVAAMGVLATGARRVLGRDPGAADGALAAVEETGRETLRELHRLLRVLDADAGVARLAPQPGLAGVPALVERARRAGLPVTLRMEGTSTAVAEGVALTAHRIVAEALRNVLAHAGPATALVRITVGGGVLTVEVVDTGRGPGRPPDRIGHGLVGMRERVALYGGILRTGPAPGGGFRVYARIPLDPAGAVPA